MYVCGLQLLFTEILTGQSLLTTLKTYPHGQYALLQPSDTAYTGKTITCSCPLICCSTTLCRKNNWALWLPWLSNCRQMLIVWWDPSYFVVVCAVACLCSAIRQTVALLWESSRMLGRAGRLRMLPCFNISSKCWLCWSGIHLRTAVLRSHVLHCLSLNWLGLM